MKTILMKTHLLAAFGVIAFGFTAVAADKYQVTGPVIEVTDSKIVVEKGKERHEFIRSPETKVTGDLKVGAKVTVMYTMTAASVEVKSDKPAK
jgi:hypothetical protein